MITTSSNNDLHHAYHFNDDLFDNFSYAIPKRHKFEKIEEFETIEGQDQRLNYILKCAIVYYAECQFTINLYIVRLKNWFDFYWFYAIFFSFFSVYSNYCKVELFLYCSSSFNFLQIRIKTLSLTCLWIRVRYYWFAMVAVSNSGEWPPRRTPPSGIYAVEIPLKGTQGIFEDKRGTRGRRVRQARRSRCLSLTYIFSVAVGQHFLFPRVTSLPFHGPRIFLLDHAVSAFFCSRSEPPTQLPSRNRAF